MPAGSVVEKAESRLKSEAKERGYSGKRANAYTFGTLNRLGYMRGNKTTKKGAAKAKTVMT